METRFHRSVAEALNAKRPVVALESTVISHGLPQPQNLKTALSLENIVRENGAVPATIAVLSGELCVGLDKEQIEYLAASQNIRKLSRCDLAVAVAKQLDGATTVATTALIAHRAGIKVFATGGIGGVHRGSSADVSADLVELARTPITVVCSGAKIVLDLAATREWLETFGVTVLGWQCDEVPAFYSRTTGLRVDERVESAAEAAAIIRGRDGLELSNAILMTVPVPAEAEIERAEVEAWLAEAIADAADQAVVGKNVTPFLLSELSKRSGGRTLGANIALLENNARVAAQIAVELSRG